MLYCVECKDGFDPVENADQFIPLCSGECADDYWSGLQVELEADDARPSE